MGWLLWLIAVVEAVLNNHLLRPGLISKTVNKIKNILLFSRCCDKLKADSFRLLKKGRIKLNAAKF
jgi:hypothetical protein